MKLFSRFATVLFTGTVIFLALAAAPASKSTAAKDMVVPYDQTKFQQVMPGISKYTLWGDPAKGPHGAITRFAKGTKVAWHTHPHDIKAVVISGTLLYDNGSGEKRLGPGSFVQERSGIKHTTAASADSDLVFYEEGAGPFAVNLVK
jgi:mannose-6-phosphate isomerase-like protein (cupin superfamily)